MVDSAAEAALFTPFERCSEWLRESSPLRKPKSGWAFSDPLRFPLAPEAATHTEATYGDRRAYERRLESQTAEIAEDEQQQAGEKKKKKKAKREARTIETGDREEAPA